MSRLTRNAIAAITVLGASHATACADNESMMFVRQVIAVRSPECLAKPEVSATFLTDGVLDVAFITRYDAAILVGNQLTARGSREQVRTETSRIALSGSEIRLLRVNETLIDEFSVPGSGFVDSATGSSPGFGVLGTTLIPEQVGSKLAGELSGPGSFLTVIAKVRAFGTTLGGEDLTSNELTFPITVCSGCLVSFPPEADDPLTPNTYDCVSGDVASGSEKQPCRVGQDDGIDCRDCCAKFGASLGDTCLCG